MGSAQLALAETPKRFVEGPERDAMPGSELAKHSRICRPCGTGRWESPPDPYSPKGRADAHVVNRVSRRMAEVENDRRHRHAHAAETQEHLEPCRIAPCEESGRR